MWYVIKTDLHKEDETRRLLVGLDGVKDVYLPIYRRTIKKDDGEQRSQFIPTIGGIMLVNMDEAKMDRLVDNWGYITYKEPVRDQTTGERRLRPVVSRAHLLLCASNPSDISRDEIISKARVPWRDVERLRVFNDRLVEGMEDLRILDASYSMLAAENDTVLIIEGPYIGIEGVIKQVKSHGRKDRRLHFSVGNFTVSVPGIRNYRHIVVREARRGEKARAVQAWRHIDQLIGRIQSMPSGDGAAGKLRDILRSLNHDVSLDDYIDSLTPDSPHYALMTQLTAHDAGCLISLSRYFQTYNNSIDVGLLDLIPDTVLRPFLTPTPGKEFSSSESFVRLSHDGIEEVIVRTDLRRYFQTMTFEDGAYRMTTMAESDEPTLDDCIYYAHVAIVREEGRTLAAVNWGGFLRQYLLKTAAERTLFHAELEEKGYVRLHALLTESQRDGSDIFLYDKGSISGFAVELGDTSPLDAACSLVTAAAPAAVEMWQDTQMLRWRKLVQRHVLLHKQTDEESDIII